MKNKTKYSTQTLNRACRLYEQKVPLRQILKKTGIKSTSTILFRCNPEYRERMYKYGEAWRKKNPEKWIAICRRANLKSKKKAHGKN